jgi:hypothetical protein
MEGRLVGWWPPYERGALCFSPPLVALIERKKKTENASIKKKGFNFKAL